MSQGGSGPPWRFGANHSDIQWQQRIAKRGWSVDQIDEAIATGQRFSATNLVHPANPATRYVHPTTGRSVVRDDVTGEVVHVGGDGFLY